jgi:hypothetical protein
VEGKKLDILNLGLLVLSFILAVFFPFKLFLFSYAILGPLHYLTEINWLDKRAYFIKSGKKWGVVLLLFSICIGLYSTVNHFSSGSSFLKDIGYWLAQNSSPILLAAILFSACLLVLKKPVHITLALLLTLLFSFGVAFFSPKYILYVGVFLPTLIHVYLFTFLFMIFGLLKNGNMLGVSNVMLMLLAPVAIGILPIKAGNYELPSYFFGIIESTNFLSVSNLTSTLFGGPLFNEGNLGLLFVKIQIFIAFAYTYHYLNWFSKTSVIGWKKSLTKTGGITVVGLWILSVSLYFYDYQTGFIAVLLLSFLHVVLEFPLNVLTIKGISKAVKKGFIS